MIEKPASRIIQDLDAKSFTALGCPGADGLGAGALAAFHEGLAGARGDFIVVLGDVSPIGRDPYYGQIAEFIDAVAAKPVYVMRGNHDGPDYSEYFGMENRAILSEEYLLIMLDNSSRRFTDDALAFLQETLSLIESDNVLIAFHVPPPNRFSGASMSRKEWQRFEDAVGVWRNRISLLLSSHAHNGFEDEVEGLKLVVTGGSGARMHPGERLAKQEHHALEIDLGGGHSGGPKVLMRPLSRSGGAALPGALPVSRELYDERCLRGMELLFRAETAETSGAYALARLCRAGAESCVEQARSLLSLTPGNDILSRLTLERAASAKQSFESLLEKEVKTPTPAGDDSTKYFVCRTCGDVSAGPEEATYCAACGAPGYFLEEIC